VNEDHVKACQVYLNQFPSMENHFRRLANRLGYSDWKQIPGGNLRSSHVLDALKKEKSASTYNCLLRAAKIIAERCGSVEATRIQAIDNKAVDAHQRRIITPEELFKLISACIEDPGPSGIRDAIVFHQMYCCELRRAALVRIQSGDEEIKPEETRPYFEAWYKMRPGAGPLICKTTQGSRGQIELIPITPDAVRGICLRRCVDAGIDFTSPQDLIASARDHWKRHRKLFFPEWDTVVDKRPCLKSMVAPNVGQRNPG